MFALALSLKAAEALTLTLLSALAALAGVILFRAVKKRRITPEERERRRRAALVAQGKLTDATLVEIQENALFYSYVVRGIEYTASQDVSGLKERMPDAGVGLGLGPVSVKYDARNPADSIVLSEYWSGLRSRKPERSTQQS